MCVCVCLCLCVSVCVCVCFVLKVVSYDPLNSDPCSHTKEVYDVTGRIHFKCKVGQNKNTISWPLRICTKSSSPDLTSPCLPHSLPITLSKIQYIPVGRHVIISSFALDTVQTDSPTPSHFKGWKPLPPPPLPPSVWLKARTH